MDETKDEENIAQGQLQKESSSRSSCTDEIDMEYETEIGSDTEVYSDKNVLSHEQDSTMYSSEDEQTETRKIHDAFSQTDIMERLPAFVTPEESNFLRFCHLIQKVAPQAVRHRFDQVFPPADLEGIIQRNKSLLETLRRTRIITHHQWTLIWPSGTTPLSSTFDVTTMMIFFRHLTTIAPRSGLYDTLPLPIDTSLGADLSRIKYYKNMISHCMDENRKMDNTNFLIFWETASKAIIRIGGQLYEQECFNLKTVSLDSSNRNVYREFLIKEMEMKKKITDQRKEIENLKKLKLKEYTQEKIRDVSHEILRYDRKAFPRVAQLQDELKRLKESEFGDVFSHFRSYADIVGDPYAILCFANDEQLAIDSNDFAVKVKDNTQMGRNSDLNLRNVFLPNLIAVVICILDCSEDRHLTKKDVSLLNNLQHLPRHYLQNMLFLKSKQSLDKGEYHSLSKQIGLELRIDSTTNNVFHRIFPYRSRELPIRLSITLENQVLMHLKEEINRFETENVGLDLKIKPIEDINEKDNVYHVLRILSQRNSLICKFSYEFGRMCVYVKDVQTDSQKVEEYLSLYMDSARDVHIRQNKKLKIRPVLIHQSGDKVEVPNMHSRFRNCENESNGGNVITNNTVQINKKSHGSASLFLSDSDRRHYFVTCSHVTRGLSGEDILVHSSNGTYHGCDEIITPLDNLDFSVVQLKPNDEHIQKGIRNKDNVHEAGKLYERDSFVIPYQTEVFKWGATSGLTIGQYIGTIEDMDDSSEAIEHGAGAIGSNPYFCIESKGYTTFAKPGDSGSLISFNCQGLTAAFGLIGCDNENPNQFIANRLSDGLALIKQTIPTIHHHLDQEMD